MRAHTDARRTVASDSDEMTGKDAAVVERVTTELDWDPRLDASRVRVRASDGVVRLVGKVRTFAEKWAASRAALRAVGVLHVYNALEIELRLCDRMSDDDLRRAVLRALQREPHAPNGHVAVEARDGRVTLRGVVDAQLEIAAAEAAVRNLPGVLDVSNDVRLRPLAGAD
jgi:osmotically-inducible protein OsmY